MEVTTPSACPRPAAGPEGAAASPIGRSDAGTAFCNCTLPLHGDSDEEIGLAEVAHLDLQRLPPASRSVTEAPMPPEHLLVTDFPAQFCRVGRDDR